MTVSIRSSEAFRKHQFYRCEDLSIYKGQTGDDGRAALPLSETLVISLLANRSDVAERTVFGSSRPVKCVTNSRQPVVATVWDLGDGSGPQVWITDGRQRAGDESQRGAYSAVGEINRRVKMLVELARNIAEREHSAGNSEVLTKPEELRVRVRNEAINRSRTVPEWSWATAARLPMFIGGRIDTSTDLRCEELIEFKPFGVVGATDGKGGELVGGPIGYEYVNWVTFEPEDRNPASFVTQLGSLALKGAQVATPPTIEAKQWRSLTLPKAPPRATDETEEAYVARIEAGGPWGSGIPITWLAATLNIDKNTIADGLRILTLEPEVQKALDAHVRGEEGLSKRQVQMGGFFVKTPTGEKIARSRDEQMKLLDELRGKRGFAKASTEDESTDASSGAGGAGLGSERREVSVNDSALDRHSAKEPRAKVGPDSPSTAGEAPKVAKLGPELFLALSERIDTDLQELTPTASGMLPNGREPTADDTWLYRMADVVYQVARYLAGDPSALHMESTSGIVTKAHAMVRDAIDEVFRSHGVAIRSGGPVATGVNVLPASERSPAEIIVTPREPASVPAPTPIAAPAPEVAPAIAVGEPDPTSPASAPAKAAPKLKKAVAKGKPKTASKRKGKGKPKAKTKPAT